MTKPIVAIIGRQNVGKSSLLNRVAGKPLVIVEDLPGTTRDRIFADVNWHGTDFTLVDTAGLELKDTSTLAVNIRAQTQAAVDEADVIIFMVDVRNGVMPTDTEIAGLLRKTKKPLLVVVNKVDNEKLESQAAEFYRLGFKELEMVSAIHGRGIADLMDKLVTVLPPAPPQEPQVGGMKVAIAGHPGVGKSLLLNKILGKERALVNDVPGTTRDAIDTILDFQGKNVVIIDTAGIRRRGKIAGVELYSVIRALRAMERADVVLLVLDASELLTAQDMHVAGYVQKAFKGVIILVNKWDLTLNTGIAEVTEYLRAKLKFFSFAPILFTSAKLGQGVNRILPLVTEVYKERMKQIPDKEVNRVIQEAYSAHNIPHKGNKELKILSAFEGGVNPPTFVFVVNEPGIIHFSYERYLENKLRQSFGFMGTPIRLVFKTGGKT